MIKETEVTRFGDAYIAAIKQDGETIQNPFPELEERGKVLSRHYTWGALKGAAVGAAGLAAAVASLTPIGRDITQYLFETNEATQFIEKLIPYAGILFLVTGALEVYTNLMHKRHVQGIMGSYSRSDDSVNHDSLDTLAQDIAIFPEQVVLYNPSTSYRLAHEVVVRPERAEQGPLN